MKVRIVRPSDLVGLKPDATYYRYMKASAESVGA